MSAHRVPVVGIIGGIGSGKTAVAEALGERLEVARIDADAIGHAVLRQPEVRAALTKRFGYEILDDSGEIVRSRLAAVVFGTAPEQQQARQELEAIVHPEIRKNIHARLDQLQDSAHLDVILLDAALLLESGWAAACDAVVYLDVPESQRRDRVSQRGWTEEQFTAREASQLSLEQKQAQADVSIPNVGTLAEAAELLADWLAVRFPKIAERSLKPI